MNTDFMLPPETPRDPEERKPESHDTQDEFSLDVSDFPLNLEDVKADGLLEDIDISPSAQQAADLDIEVSLDQLSVDPLDPEFSVDTSDYGQEHHGAQSDLSLDDSYDPLNSAHQERLDASDEEASKPSAGNSLLQKYKVHLIGVVVVGALLAWNQSRKAPADLTTTTPQLEPYDMAVEKLQRSDEDIELSGDRRLLLGLPIPAAEPEASEPAGTTSQLRRDPQGRLIDSQGRLVDERGRLVDAQGRLINEQGQLVDESGNPLSVTSNRDAQGRLVDRQGRLVDERGRLIDAQGRLIDEQGRLVDAFGRPVDASGNLLESFQTNAQGQRVDSQGRLVDSQGRLIDQHGRLINSQGQLVDEQGRPVDAFGRLVDSQGRPLATQPAKRNAQGQMVNSQGQLVDEQGRLVDSQGRLINAQGQLIDEYGQPLIAESNTVAAIESPVVAAARSEPVKGDVGAGILTAEDYAKAGIKILTPAELAKLTPAQRAEREKAIRAAELEKLHRLADGAVAAFGPGARISTAQAAQLAQQALLPLSAGYKDSRKHIEQLQKEVAERDRVIRSLRTEIAKLKKEINQLKTTKKSTPVAKKRSDIVFLGAIATERGYRAHAKIGNNVFELERGQRIGNLKVDSVSANQMVINGAVYD